MSPELLDRVRRLLGDEAITLVDIGSRGGFETDFAEIAAVVDAIGFEPDPEAFSLLGEAFSPWRGATHLPYAIGDSNGPSTLHIPGSPEGASLRPHNEAMIERYGYENLHRDVKRIPIETRTLDSLRQDASLPPVDILKVDIEGIELEMLRAAEATLARTLYIKVEGSFLEQRIGQATVWPLATFLIERGFRIIELHDIHRWRRRPLPAHPYVARYAMPYSRGEIAQVDLIAVKDEAKLSDPASLLKLAVILAAAGYFDSAATALATRADLFAADDERPALLAALLRDWSSWRARSICREQLRLALRGLVPMLRSRLGGVPTTDPAIPY